MTVLTVSCSIGNINKPTYFEAGQKDRLYQSLLNCDNKEKYAVLTQPSFVAFKILLDIDDEVDLWIKKKTFRFLSWRNHNNLLPDPVQAGLFYKHLGH